MRLVVASVLAAVTAASAADAQPRVSPPPRPSLVLFLAVDQLKPEYLDVYRPQLTGGLARLLREGAYFANAYQDHAITETAPGHASMLSGRFPRSTGIVANTDGVQDPATPLVEARGDGASPYRFRGTTLGDWLRYHDPMSRLLSVSRKDRSAILPLGRAKGSAFWYALDGTFTTSTYYADTLPTWIKRFNARRLPQRQAGQAWTLLLDPSAYAEPDSVEFEGAGGGSTFPHVVPADTARATRALQNFPVMDDITLQLALEGLQANQLGSQEGRTDLLSISLSTTDAIGHRYGPDSREIHDQVLRLDRYLGAFLDSLYKLRDSSRIVIAMTSDHGAGPNPNPAVTTRYRKGVAGTTDIRPVAAAIRRSVIAAGVDSSAFRYDGEVLFLEPEPFSRARVSRDSVARVYARMVSRAPGVLRAEVWDDVRKRDPRRDPLTRRWQHMIAPDMPAAVVVTLKPFWYWAEGTNFGRHGTPHDYDAHVPVIFAGAGIRPGRYTDFTRVVDIAPTLAAVVRVRPMEALDGVVLRKALR